jgi:hypothetical protein
MNTIHSPRIGLAALWVVTATTTSAIAQTLDWGSWDSNGTGTYANGDSIGISSLVNGSTSAVNNETSTPHVISDPAFPFANSPGIGEYGYFHNDLPTTTDWSILIDLSGFTLGSSSVIGFSNLDGRAANSQAAGFATILFLDANGDSVSISSASLLGSFDYEWQGITWDGQSSFNTATGRWDVIPKPGGVHQPGSYFASVGNAFFLTNLPSNVEKIVYTKSGTTNYSYDSTLFYAGNVIPEPSSVLLCSLAGLAGVLRRRR